MNNFAAILSLVVVLLIGAPAAQANTPPGIVPLNLGERDIRAGLITTQLLVTPLPSNPMVMWSDLQPLVEPNFGVPVIPATLSGPDNGTFTWDPTGSRTGVPYRWVAMVSTSINTDMDVVVSLILVPEPASHLFLLLGGALVSGSRFRRLRRRIARFPR